MTKVIKCKKTKTHFFGHKLFTKSNETKVFVNLGVSQALRSKAFRKAFRLESFRGNFPIFPESWKDLSFFSGKWKAGTFPKISEKITFFLSREKNVSFQHNFSPKCIIKYFKYCKTSANFLCYF